MPTAIHSKRVLLPDGMKEATIFLEGGVITGIMGGHAVAEGVNLVDVEEIQPATVEKL